MVEGLFPIAKRGDKILFCEPSCLSAVKEDAPALLRGDCGCGNEGIMRAAEARELPFLFKLRLTANVKRMIEKLSGAREWVDAGQGFEAKESAVRLTGWSRTRRVIVLRRRVKDAVGLSLSDDGDIMVDRSKQIEPMKYLRV